MAEEAGLGVQDVVSAALVECVPDVPLSACPTPETMVASPVQQAMQATLEQTGADPPPREHD